MLEAAKTLHDPDNNVVGYLARGLKNANVPVWTHLMQGWDMDPISPDGTFNTETPEAVESATFYQTLLSDVLRGRRRRLQLERVPVGLCPRTRRPCGRTASASPRRWKTRNHVARSSGKVGYGVFPKGPVAHHSAMFGDGIGVSSVSEKKGPAYYYCLWATNKVNQLRVLQAGAAVPPRMSALDRPEPGRRLDHAAEYFDCLAGSGAIVRPGLPEIIPVTEFRDIFGIGLTNMIGGADPAAELAKATADFMPIYEKSEQG